MQIAACHVSPDDVPVVITLIDRVGKAKNSSRAGSDATQVDPVGDAPKSDSLDAEWTRLKDGDTSIYQDPVRLTEHLRALENFATNLDEQGNASEARTREVADQILRWTEISQAAKNANYVDQCLSKLNDKELGQMTTDRAVSIVQAAEATLPSFWGIRSQILPDVLQRKINTYPSVIKDRVDKISTKKSVDLLKRIDDALKVVDNLGPPPTLQKRGEVHNRCLAIEKQIKEAQVLAAQLPSPNDILGAQDKIEKRTQALQRSRSEQYSLYQSAVIDRCQKAFKHYNEYTLGISEGNAIITIHNERLSQVDQALLTPEVSRLFNDVLGKLLAKLGPENLVKIEEEMGSTAKKKLENF